MALIKCDFYSEVLNLSTSMTVILPQQTHSQIGMDNHIVADKHPTLYLLHGFSDDHTIWTRRTSIERYVAPLGLAVVMPQVDHSFYSDMKHGHNYWTFLTEELPHLARSLFPLSEAREDNFVAGLSMGGYGALKWALNYPERFAAAASLSGVTDIVAHQKRNRKEPESLFAQTFQNIFGDQELEGTTSDLLSLLKTKDKDTVQKPKLYQCCGTEDHLYKDNLLFTEACKQTGFELTTDFGPGEHEWGYWDEKIQDVLKWLPL
ncbi:S-formylglutathione hydrolase FrmB [Pullulanibacillus pueri]|uniref:Esterase n=1 Tax=Pullulanibacillus pueri TaxID=1437324 RepID=A0A8J3EM66_9BACL|nr:alpha/beta hydrolase family protein [Pullulanibacillus pueri]MBM7680652.1 S-formylglutathione hydrolase FrmB [Pullulanibacillus pueri]GGH83842.1 esterase [Pullulanibacillus pueri]